MLTKTKIQPLIIDFFIISIFVFSFAIDIFPPLVQKLLFTLVAIIFLVKFEKGENKGIFSTRGAGIIDSLLSLLLFFVVLEELNNFVPVIDHFSTILKMDVVDKFTALFAFGIVGPIYEELVFRQILILRLKRHMPLFYSYGISTLVFGFIHLNQGLVAFIVALTAGAILSLIRYKYNKLTGSILFHSFYNIIILLESYGDLKT